MLTKIQKWGNSLAVRVPKVMAKSLNLEEGTPIHIEGETVTQTVKIRPVAVRPVYSLRQLVKGITPVNRHKEVDWGPPRGREVW